MADQLRRGVLHLVPALPFGDVLDAEVGGDVDHARARIQQRLQENAEVVGTDEAFFEDDDANIIRDLYTEKSGVNQIVVDSADDFKGVARNVAFSLSLYTGQMCTAPQNIYVPKDGIDTAYLETGATLGSGLMP